MGGGAVFRAVSKRASTIAFLLATKANLLTTQHILESYPILSPAEKNRRWKLVMKKATVYRSQDDKLTVNIYPNLPK